MGASVRIADGSRVTVREGGDRAAAGSGGASASARDPGARATARESGERATVREAPAPTARAEQRYVFGGTPYDGAYEVTPTASEQSLPTRDRLMRGDVTVHKVPYFETSNESGGYTISILS